MCLEEVKVEKGPGASESVTLEEEVLARWRDLDITRRLLQHNKGSEYFRFLEGPPTANAPPGVHHIFARTIKDAIDRHRNMKGDIYQIPKEYYAELDRFMVEIYGSSINLSVRKECFPFLYQ